VSPPKQDDIVVPAKSILISGAGIAGPTLAYWLDRYGFDVTLVERAPRPRTGGYIIDFWGLGYDVADRMQVVRALQETAYKVQELRLVDAEGRRVGGFGAGVFRQLTGGRYLSLPRSALAKLLYDVIAERCPIIFGDSIRELVQTDAGVDVSFERAPGRHFDLVIGADGQHSVVRKLAFGEEDRFERYLGYAVAAFEGKQYRPRDQNVYVSYGLPGKQVARFALRDDDTLFLLVFTASSPPAVPAHDTRAQKAYLHVEFDGAGWECGRILDALDRCDEIYFDRVSQIHLRRWSHDRVALVGDAAAAPSLLAGQGAALAMTAAYVLAGELARARGDHRKAFARYEAMLREFLDGKQASAQRFAGSFLPQTRLGIFLRNQVTKLFGLPAVANYVLGRGLLDRLALPDYSSELQTASRSRRNEVQA
jgi:2-polyprenyl-6-methoxyphenol hydroxylase-like FAD-dependent oxidoreductase